AESSAWYQRNDRPSGGNRSDCDAVSEVSSTIRLGPMSTMMATAVSVPNTSRNDTLSQSTAAAGAGASSLGTLSMGMAGLRVGHDAGEQIEQRDDHQYRDHEDDRNRRRERPIVGTDRLLINVQRHVDEARAADQGLGDEGGDARCVGEDAAGDHARQ